MKRTCSKCGKPGHYASTCGRAPSDGAKPKAKTKPERAPRRQAERLPAPEIAPAGTLPEGSVLEQLRARRQQLVRQIGDIARLQRELDLLDPVIEELAAIQGGA